MRPAKKQIDLCIYLAAFPLFVAACLVYLFAFQPLPGIPSFDQVRSSHVKSEGTLLDRNGEIIHEMRIDRRGRRLDWIPLGRISPAMQSAIVAAEDHRFFRHGGVDWISLCAAFPAVFRSSGGRGASTLTMQLAARLDEELKPEKHRRSLLQKSRQIRAARTLENSWSKAQILECYLNLVTFRGELQGIAAAAGGLFSKEPQGLNDVESMILAALVCSPNAGSGAVAARVDRLARAMNSTAGRAEIEAAVESTLSRPYYLQPKIALAPHVAQRLFQARETGGRRGGALISSTLDGRLQAFAAEALRRHVLSAKSQNMNDGAVLVAENESGDILAYVGNTGDQASARFVDGVLALRQAGSTLKPFLYALVFGRRLLTPASLIDDSPTDIPVQGGIYRPRNYDSRFHGSVTARVALASSLNVPAVKALNLAGVDTFVDVLKSLGFRGIQTSEFYGPSLALGAADVTLWDLVNAYRTLANSGVWSPLSLTADKAESRRRQVFSAESAFLISNILSDRESRTRTFALESPLSTRFWTAVKTGTSKDMRDNWCVGFSEHYTVGVWTGNFSGESMWDVSGITGAAPVWVEIMNRLHESQSSLTPHAPAGIVQRTVDFSANADVRQEWFIQGTETGTIRPAAGALVSRIAYPTAGTVVALDPDIPQDAQQMFFEASPRGSNLEWMLDGRRLGSASALTPWRPRRGKHILKLMDSALNELDSVDFEVRGNY